MNSTREPAPNASPAWTEAGRRGRLHDGTNASAGDTILTRRNDRRLPISASDWVKNGDRWHVDTVTADGALRVIHAGTRRRVTLPAGYVELHVELGYATTVHLAQGATATASHTVLTGRETREILYVAMTRGRTANHVYLDLAPAAAADGHAATTPQAIRPATSIEILTGILANETAPRSATSQHRLDTDPGRRLHTAATCYAESVAAAPGTPGHGPRPLPWLAPLPDTDDAWAEYLQRRYDLVQDLADKITARDVLPTTQWAHTLHENTPELAHQLALWRATHAVLPDDTRPCGRPVRDARASQRELTARVDVVLDHPALREQRWRPLVEAIDASLARDTFWPALTRAFDRAEYDGYPVAARLPDLITRDRFGAQPGQELFYRLGSECDAALGPTPEPGRVLPPISSPRPPLPHRAHQQPTIHRGGPPR